MPIFLISLTKIMRLLMSMKNIFGQVRGHFFITCNEWTNQFVA